MSISAFRIIVLGILLGLAACGGGSGGGGDGGGAVSDGGGGGGDDGDDGGDDGGGDDGGGDGGGDDGGGSDGPPAPLTFQVTLTGLELVNRLNDERIEATGLPVSGAVVSLEP